MMASSPSICILTDSTAQCLTDSFRGVERVSVLPYQAAMDEMRGTDVRTMRLSAFPLSLRAGVPVIHPPSVEDFCQAFISLGIKYHEIVVLLPSGQLGPSFAHAEQAAQQVKCSAVIHLVDSGNTSVGLGLLVQIAAEAAENGLNGAAISRLLRGLSPHVFSMFCVQSLTYLSQYGWLDPAQAIVGEMLGVMPFLVLDHGRLTTFQKARSPRHLLDTLYEFVTEFVHARRLAIIQGLPPFDQEGRALRERVGDSLEHVVITEHPLQPPVAAVFGPRCLGVVVLEDTPELHGYL